MKKTNIIGLLAIFLLIFSLGVSAATLTRTAQSSVNPGSTFSVTYATSGTSGKYFVAWEDSITGGCTPSTYKSFIGSESGIGESKSVTFTAPSSGSCTFNGYYQYGSGAKVNFPGLTITICAPATCSSLGKQCGSWINNCGITLNCGSCSSGQTCSSAGQCLTCNTAADINCDNKVDFNELTTYANNWVVGSVTFDNLLSAAQAWVNSI